MFLCVALNLKKFYAIYIIFLFLPPLSIPQFFLYQLLKRKQLQIFSGEKWASGKFFLKLPFSIYYSEFSLSGISTFNREAFFNGKKFMWHNFFYTFFFMEEMKWKSLALFFKFTHTPTSTLKGSQSSMAGKSSFPPSSNIKCEREIGEKCGCVQGKMSYTSKGWKRGHMIGIDRIFVIYQN